MKGFTIFFAMLVGSLSLAIGLAIYDLTIRELDLSATATQSQYAIYAADAGAECVLYWDSKYGAGNNSSAFATSSASSQPNTNIFCVGQDVAANGTPPATYVAPPTGWTPWGVVKPVGQNAATTTFTLVLGTTATSACAAVEVAKRVVSGSVSTVITSRGYNVCNPTYSPRVERRFQVSY